MAAAAEATGRGKACMQQQEACAVPYAKRPVSTRRTASASNRGSGCRGHRPRQDVLSAARSVCCAICEATRQHTPYGGGKATAAAAEATSRGNNFRRQQQACAAICEASCQRTSHGAGKATAAAAEATCQGNTCGRQQRAYAAPPAKHRISTRRTVPARRRVSGCRGHRPRQHV